MNTSSDDTTNNSGIEKFICHEDDLNENELKPVSIGNEEILIIKQHGQIHALGAKCAHNGLPLKYGALGNGRIRCFAHGACFNICTGDIEDYPGLDSIPRYNARVVNGFIKVTVSEQQLKISKHVKPMMRRCPKDCRTIVIVGGGFAGATCAEVLRQEGFTGRIVILNAERYLPYDRTSISKQTNLDLAHIQLRDLQFYAGNSIEVFTKRTVIKLNTVRKRICCNTGETFNYSKCFIATGCKPLMPNIIGQTLENIFTIRKFDDYTVFASKITKDTNLVCIGSGLISLEIAGTYVNLAGKVTIITPSEFPLARVVGVTSIGEAIRKYCVNKGIKFLTGSRIVEFVGRRCRINAIRLATGTLIDADVCVIAIGVGFNSDFLNGTNVKLNENGSILVDKFLRTSIEEIYAGGDIAHAPVMTNDMTQMSVLHVQVAQYHGRIAALNMLQRSVPLRTVPFFSIKLCDKNLRFVGTESSRDVLIVGSLEIEKFKFLIFYFKDAEVIGMLSCGMDYYTAKYAEFLADGKRLSKCYVQVDPFEWAGKFPE